MPRRERIEEARRAARAFLASEFRPKLSRWILASCFVGRPPATVPDRPVTFREYLRTVEAIRREEADTAALRVRRIEGDRETAAGDEAIDANARFLRHRNVKRVLDALETLAGPDPVSGADWERLSRLLRRVSAVLEAEREEHPPDQWHPALDRSFDVMIRRWDALGLEPDGPAR